VLLREVVNLARVYGWLHYHTLYSLGSEEGFPDLVLVRGNRMLFVELKRSQKERLRPAQKVWHEAINRANRVCLVWTPELWDEIRKLMR